MTAIWTSCFLLCNDCEAGKYTRAGVNTRARGSISVHAVASTNLLVVVSIVDFHTRRHKLTNCTKSQVSISLAKCWDLTIRLSSLTNYLNFSFRRKWTRRKTD